MNVEMDALEKNETWELIELPRGKKPVGCKWVFTVKYKADGTLERYKARLVAKGYIQTYGVDYQETFAPVAKMNTVRVLLSLAVNYNWPLQQFDVKNAFLHGELEEEIYMEVPLGQSQGDHTLFIKHTNSGGVIALMIYVDDIIVTGNDEKEREALKQCLVREFEIKELGRLKYFLGIEVAHSEQGILISQNKYVIDLLKETGKLACKPANTRIDLNHKLGEAKEDVAVNRETYQRLVGKLIYLSQTRSDIAYAANPGKGILFKRNTGLVLEAYTDVDYAGSVVDRRSTSGYCTFLGGNLVTWRSKKQNVVARSSAEAEFRAMAQGVCELLWLKIILEDLKVKWEGPMKLYCDNKSAINIAHNPVQHDKTKHIEVDRHFIKEKLDSGLICTPYVPTKGQLADVLTKGLNSGAFQDIISKLGMTNAYSPA
ncbi:hypothetical protein LWI29_002881 [Acer saccharum]|uniref:Reverse transcriptase Ty1/copia-type domain-containing protein n=1 Tax=Acer saccharum TaxID=4024 RepID=A0AA39RUD0_ACESA|nr:hypothetical protein LWI29_002881 [Acer saccharum]